MATLLTKKIVDGHSVGYNTATADTAITAVIPPKKFHLKSVAGALVGPSGNLCKTVLQKAVYTAAGTAHSLLALRCLNRTYLTAAAAAGQANIVVAADPGVGTVAGAIASGDYVLIQKSDGTWHLGVANAGISTLTITLNANVPTGGFAAGAEVYFFGATTDSHVVPFRGTASATSTYEGDNLLTSDGPILLYSANATAAGILQQASAVYTR
jgi:hypothetical protein